MSMCMWMAWNQSVLVVILHSVTAIERPKIASDGKLGTVVKEGLGENREEDMSGTYQGACSSFVQ